MPCRIFWTTEWTIFNEISFNSSKNEKSFEFLVAANDQSEWMWRIYFKCMICAFIATAGMGCASVMFCSIVKDEFDVNHLHHKVRVMWFCWISRRNSWNGTENEWYFCLVCLGTIEHRSGILVSYWLVKSWANLTCLLMDRCFCFLSQFAGIIKLSLKYFGIQSRIGAFPIKIEMMRKFFVIWFVFIFQAKSEYKKLKQRIIFSHF